MHLKCCSKQRLSCKCRLQPSRIQSRCHKSLGNLEGGALAQKKNHINTKWKLQASADVYPTEGEENATLGSKLKAFSNILVTGSTGGTGASVVQQLADMGLEVRALTRDAKKAKSVLPPSATVAEGDLFSYTDTSRAVEGCDAIVICSGPTSRMDPLSPFKVDFQGVENIVAAAKASGVKKIVLVSSIGADDPFFPLNIFGAVLVMKKLGELCVQRSNIDYTILRPGGLLNQERNGAGPSNPVVGSANTFGLPPRKLPGSILRSKVAEACIAALVEPEASNKVIEVISQKDAPSKSWKELFASIP